MRRWVLGAVFALVVLGLAAAASYVVLNHFYGERDIAGSTQTMIIKNSGQQVSIENVQYDVENAEFVSMGADGNSYLLDLQYSYYTGNGAPPTVDESYVSKSISVPAEAYEQAQTTGEPVTVSTTTTTETRSIDALPIAASIGIAMGLTVFAAWVGYRRAWGDATSTLIDLGLHDMTVRDIEIVGYIMERGKFTIPEIMKQTKASKITVWRTVQKLVEQGLVRQTEETKLAANGIGGRGKPSHVYEYIGEKGTKLKT